MSYKVTNPTERDIILNRFEGGDTVVVPAGKSIKTDNPRVALTLEEAGAVLEQTVREQAIDDEVKAEAARRDRPQRRDRADEGSGEPTPVNPNVAAAPGSQAAPLVEVKVGDDGTTTPAPGGDERTDGKPAGEQVQPDDEPLKGEALDAALEELSLPKTGTADEKRARLAEARAAVASQG